jgi:hypothetical protein
VLKKLYGFLQKIKKIILAEPNKDWIVRDWEKDFELLPNHVLNLEKMIEKKGYKV